MGAWGYHSYENDTTHDSLSMDIGLNYYADSNMDSLSVQQEKIDKYFQIPTDHADFQYIGTVMWALSKNFGVPKLAKFLVKKELELQVKDLENGDDKGWVDPDARIRAIKKELKQL